MLANYHTHTARCQHARGEDKAYVEAAISAGMQVLGFSDHCPWIFPDGYISPTRMRPNQLDDYFSSIDQLKREYAHDITIYTGFECEYLPDLMDAQEKLLADYPVDYRILGQHFNANEMYAPYTGNPTDSVETLIRYVDFVLAAMETGNYCYTAHPDLIHFIGDEQLYETQMLRLCQSFKKHNIPIEINVLGVREKRHYTARRFLKLCQKVGNCVIIGCDAHAPEQLCDETHIAICRQMAADFGLEVVDFLPNLMP